MDVGLDNSSFGSVMMQPYVWLICEDLLAISPLQIFQYYLSSEIHIIECELYLLSGGDDRALMKVGAECLCVVGSSRKYFWFFWYWCLSWSRFMGFTLSYKEEDWNIYPFNFRCRYHDELWFIKSILIWHLRSCFVESCQGWVDL